MIQKKIRLKFKMGRNKPRLEGEAILNNLPNGDERVDSLHQVGTLELLIISNKNIYRDAGKDFFTSLTKPDGHTLFNVVLVDKDELAASLTPSNGNSGVETSTLPPLHYRSDVVFFDLNDGTLTSSSQLPLLDRYLSKNKRSYAIVSVRDDQLGDLLKNYEWISLQRDIPNKALLLTQSYRLPSTGRGLKKEDYIRYFDWVYRDMLNDAVLSFITQLKSRPKTSVRKRIVQLPTEFGEFSGDIRREFGSSRLVRESLDIIAGFEPDDTISLLEELQPADDKGYSVPQHCYPPFEKLRLISQQTVIDSIRDQGANPLSLYVHIPFCATLCTYCDYTTIIGAGKNAYIRCLDLLRREIQNIYNLTEWKPLPLQCVQLGGGTPSILPHDLISELGKILRSCLFFLKDNFQMTTEFSPGTTTPEKADAFKEIGVNRVSIGLQSISDEVLLNWVDRWFSTKKGKKAVELLLERWPDATNIDMLYGLPGQAINKWEDDLNAAIELRVPSITFYNLRVSPRTKFVEGQEFPKIYERMLMYVMATQKFLEEGFVQSSDNQVVRSIERQPYIYKEAKKRGGNTLGIGVSSYSIFPSLIYFNQGGRDNKACENLEKYAKAVDDGRLPVEVGKIMNEREQMSLFMTQGLKLSGIDKVANGVDLVEFQRRFGKPVDNAFFHTQVLLDKGLLEIKGNYLGLTYKGLAFEELVLKSYWR